MRTALRWQATWPVSCMATCCIVAWQRHQTAARQSQAKATQTDLYRRYEGTAKTEPSTSGQPYACMHVYSHELKFYNSVHHPMMSEGCGRSYRAWAWLIRTNISEEVASVLYKHYQWKLMESSELDADWSQSISILLRSSCPVETHPLDCRAELFSVKPPRTFIASLKHFLGRNGITLACRCGDVPLIRKNKLDTSKIALVRLDVQFH